MTLKYIFFLTTSALTLFYSYYFSCLHLLNVAERIPTMRYVGQVLQKNLTQMVAALILVGILLYIYSVFAYALDVIRGDQTILDKDPLALGRSNLLLNTFFYWDYGFREGPVFANTFLQSAARANGGVLPPGEDINYGQIVLGFLFDFSYHLFVVLIFSAVVSGIIIDAFAELRTNNNMIQHENANTCFICDIERDDFEKNNLNFKTHIKEDHNMWDYVFFRFYLEGKDPIDYTGLETYCAERIKSQQINWLPINRAIAIEGRNKEKKDLPTLFVRLNRLETQNTATSQEVVEIRQELAHVHKATDDIRRMLRELTQQQARERADTTRGADTSRTPRTPAAPHR